MKLSHKTFILTSFSSQSSLRSRFLELPFELRQNVYKYIFTGEELRRTDIAPRRSIQTHVGISYHLPGSSLLATCRKIPDEGSVYLFRTVHFTTQFSINGFIALQRFNWHATTIAMHQSLDVHSTSIVLNGCGSWSSDLHMLTVGIPKLKFFCFSTAFRGDMTDGDSPVEMVDLPPHPINYPYKARLAINSRRQVNCLSLEKGDEGKVLQTSDKNFI